MKIETLQDELINAGLYEASSYESAEDAEGFFLTTITKKETGLAMCIFLRCVENKGDPPFLRFQNDRKLKPNCNWVKMYLDGTLDNYENKNIVFSENEMQELKTWIALNKEAICKHYYQEYDSIDVYKVLKNVWGQRI